VNSDDPAIAVIVTGAAKPYLVIVGKTPGIKRSSISEGRDTCMASKMLLKMASRLARRCWKLRKAFGKYK
jgi:hypothetical protein